MDVMCCSMGKQSLSNEMQQPFHAVLLVMDVGRSCKEFVRILQSRSLPLWLYSTVQKGMRLYCRSTYCWFHSSFIRFDSIHSSTSLHVFLVGLRTCASISLIDRSFRNCACSSFTHGSFVRESGGWRQGTPKIDSSRVL